MSLPMYERRMTGLRCNSCGHQFEDFAWRHEAIQTNDQGVIGWNIASGNAFSPA